VHHGLHGTHRYDIQVVATHASIYILYTHASPSGRSVNYDEKQRTGEKMFSCSLYLYRFCKYVSYGFPVIIFL